MLGHVRCPQWCLEGLPPIPFPGDLFPFQNCAQVPTHVLGRLAGTSCVPFPFLSSCRCFNGSSNFFLSSWVDHASRVMWAPSSTDIPVAADVSAANWRQHFSSVGAPPQCFDNEFFEEVSILLWVSTTCRTLCSKRISLGGNQQSSTSSISSSLGEWSPLRGSAALWFLSSSVGTHPCPPTFAPFLSPVVASKSSSTWSMRELAPTSLPNSTNVKGVSVGVRTL